jgi:Asp/Glu/hydantoin racemase
MSQPRIGLIHALAHSVAPINDALARDWPDALRMNLLDDSLSADLAAGGGLDGGLNARMHARFERLADYAFGCGCDALLFTCSAFGPCIETVARRHAGKPVLKPNEAMIADAVASGLKVGLVATFAPTLRSMPAEFPAPPALALAEGALAALNAGQPARHDERIADAALGLVAEGCGIVALAQFSMARAAALVRERSGVPVLTTVDSAVRELHRRLHAG